MISADTYIHITTVQLVCDAALVGLLGSNVGVHHIQRHRSHLHSPKLGIVTARPDSRAIRNSGAIGGPGASIL